MSTIQNLFQQAQLAEAAYADFSPVGMTTEQALVSGDSKFSAAQAAEFVTHWRVVNQYTAPSFFGFGGSGFSGTVFESLEQPGKYTFAVRGTEPNKASDLVADIFGIGGQGTALRQALDLYNYRKSLGTTSGQLYQAAYLKVNAPATALLTPLWLASTLPELRKVYNASKAQLESQGFWVEDGTVSTLALGSSNLVSVSSGLDSGRRTATVQLGPAYDVVGHSLGGHLAMVLGRLDNSVASVETFNPPFFDPFTSVNYSERFFTQLQQLENTASGSTSIGNGYMASQNYVVSGDLVNLIGATRPGVPSQIFSEGEGPNALTAHSMPKITDSLAVYALFAKLDPSLNTRGLDSIAGILKASSSIAANSLEVAVAALGKLFGKTYSAVESKRDDLYTHLKEMQIAVQGKTLTIVSLTNMTAGEIKAIAADPDMIATRYALKELNPFIVLGADYSRFNMNGELNLVDTAGQGDLSINWIEDRAAMLAWTMKLNTEDRVTSLAVPYTDPLQPGVTAAQYFDDRASGQKLYLGADNTGGSNETRRRFVFGTDTTTPQTGGADQLTGGALDDRLYGMAGKDVLQGLGGNDHIEGGRDDDFLIGGAGSDLLNGGQGYDTYAWNAGDGNDTILDYDKSGRILINGSGVKLLIKQTATTWTTPDGKVTLAQTDGRWKLSMEGGSLDLGTSFSDSDYGIYRIEITSGGPIIRGDLKPIDHDITTPAEDLQYDSLGNVVVSTAEAPGREDRLYGAEIADTLLGLEGNDIINGKGDADLMEGGTGSDILIGDAGNDMIYGLSGPAGSTPIASALEAGDSDANQDARGDWVDGQSGDDILVGTAAKDLLTGGADNDLLIGGAGNDLLLGDAALAQAWPDWNVDRRVEPDAETNSDLYRWTVTRGSTTESDSIGGADVLYGGKGEDWLLGGAGDDLLDGAGDDGQRDHDLDFGNGDRLVIRNGELDKVQAFQFADGTTPTTGELLAAMPRADLLGEAGADFLQGHAGGDALVGQGGDDTLLGSIAVTPHRRRTQSRSRRWRHGERNVRAGNDTSWRSAA